MRLVTEAAVSAILTRAIRDELVWLWTDLDIAITLAANGEWSVTCDNVEERIKNLTQLVGPTPWTEVPTRLLVDKPANRCFAHYQRIHYAMGLKPEEYPVDYEAAFAHAKKIGILS
jgi:hypothetical protein